MAIHKSVWIVLLFGVVASEFIVNVKTQHGNVVKQSIIENTTDSSVILEYTDWDLTKITQVVDYRNGINIFRVVTYGEIDLGQPPFQVLCFVHHLTETDFIEPDAISKLRQKNQDATRTSENQLGTIFNSSDISINIDSSDVISPHIQEICKGTNGAIFSTEKEISKVAKDFSRDYDLMMGSTRRLTAMQLPRCSTTVMPSQACSCHYQFSIDWYPCSLRYCKGETSGKPTMYKCGIKTCGVTRLYEFPVSKKAECWWERKRS